MIRSQNELYMKKKAEKPKNTSDDFYHYLYLASSVLYAVPGASLLVTAFYSTSGIITKFWTKIQSPIDSKLESFRSNYRWYVNLFDKLYVPQAITVASLAVMSSLPLTSLIPCLQTMAVITGIGIAATFMTSSLEGEPPTVRDRAIKISHNIAQTVLLGIMKEKFSTLFSIYLRTQFPQSILTVNIISKLLSVLVAKAIMGVVEYGERIWLPKAQSSLFYGDHLQIQNKTLQAMENYKNSALITKAQRKNLETEIERQEQSPDTVGQSLGKRLIRGVLPDFLCILTSQTVPNVLLNNTIFATIGALFNENLAFSPTSVLSVVTQQSQAYTNSLVKSKLMNSIEESLEVDTQTAAAWVGLRKMDNFIGKYINGGLSGISLGIAGYAHSAWEAIPFNFSVAGTLLSDYLFLNPREELQK